MIQQLFVWRQIVNALVGLDRVVKIDKAQQAEMTAFAILKRLLLMPQSHCPISCAKEILKSKAFVGLGFKTLLPVPATVRPGSQNRNGRFPS